MGGRQEGFLGHGGLEKVGGETRIQMWGGRMMEAKGGRSAPLRGEKDESEERTWNKQDFNTDSSFERFWSRLLGNAKTGHCKIHHCATTPRLRCMAGRCSLQIPLSSSSLVTVRRTSLRLS
jgi:hypothetical protein